MRLGRIPIILAICVLLAAESFCTFQVHVLAIHRQKLKKDEAAVNNVTFGLLSVMQWRDKIAAAAMDEVRNFQLTPQQRQELKKEVTQMLLALVHHVDSIMNRPKHTLGGKAKKLAYHLLVKPKKIDTLVPGFAQKIVDKLDQPASKSRIKHLLESKIQNVKSHIQDTSDLAKAKAIKKLLQKYNAADQADFNKKNQRQINIVQQQTYYYTLAAIASIIFLALFWWILWKRPEMHRSLYVVSILAALVLLLAGLTTPMIEVDARIADLQFQMLNEHVQFKNQVLFFQSKSIVDVVLLLVRAGKYDTILVGILILCFSILFPLTKLICSGLFLFNPERWKGNRFITFFAFKSGKWSMADVMVVAIIMAYIGFNGIITSALQSLDIHQNSLTSIATNHTALQPGYLIFIVFVLYSLVLSKILEHISGGRNVN